MPTYDYQCSKCKHRFELFHSIRDDASKRCPRCKARAKRVPSSGAGLLFKGSGFYITDYRSASYKERAKQDRSGTGGGAGSGSGDSGSKESSGSTGTPSASGGSGAAGSSSPASSSGSGSSEKSGGGSRRRPKSPPADSGH